MIVDTKSLCDKVVVNRDGLSKRPADAFHQFGEIPRVIFIRADGWSLGASGELEDVALTLWIDQWVAFRRWPDYDRRPMADYQASKRRSRRTTS